MDGKDPACNRNAGNGQRRALLAASRDIVKQSELQVVISGGREAVVVQLTLVSQFRRLGGSERCENCPKHDREPEMKVFIVHLCYLVD